MKKFHENYSSWRICQTNFPLIFLNPNFSVESLYRMEIKIIHPSSIRAEKVSWMLARFRVIHRKISTRFVRIYRKRSLFPFMPTNTIPPTPPTYSKTSQKPLRATLITFIAMKSNHRSRFEELVEKEEAAKERERGGGGTSDDRRKRGEYLARERG